MDSDTLDAVADAINPALVLFILFITWRYYVQKRTVPWAFLTATIVSIVIVYVIQYLDVRLSLWPALGLDYSTHTAFAAALISSLAFLNPRLLSVLVPVFVLYAVLMMYLDYHTIADILTAAIVIAPLTLATHFLLWGRRRMDDMQ